MDQQGATPAATTVYSPAWVVRHLGISAATLRSWHHRYQVGPSARTPGRHRR